MMDALAQAPALTEIVLDLPYPPSVNKIWRSSAALSANRVHLSPSYVKWKNEADGLLMTTPGWQRMRLSGPFTIEIDLCPPTKYPRGDLDNRIKATLDYLERVNVIVNDRLCLRLTAQWVEQDRAPHGCRVKVRPAA